VNCPAERHWGTYRAVVTRNVRLAIGFAVLLLGTLILALGYNPTGTTGFDSGLFGFCNSTRDVATESDLGNVSVMLAAGVAMLAGLGFIVSCFFGGADEDAVA
jgi:hypothetical protein